MLITGFYVLNRQSKTQRQWYKTERSRNFEHFCSINDQNCCRFIQSVILSMNHLIILALNIIVLRPSSSFLALEIIVRTWGPLSSWDSLFSFVPELSAVSHSLHQVGICSVDIWAHRSSCYHFICSAHVKPQQIHLHDNAANSIYYKRLFDKIESSRTTAR